VIIHLGMILPENRFPLFGIMPYSRTASARLPTNCNTTSRRCGAVRCSTR
jgi:hypothetical protein